MAINRNATATDAGFRLQKMRAVKLILSELSKDRESTFWCSLEQGADVVLKSAEESKVSVYEEEDKHYDPETSFTLNSTEVLNTFVILIDRLYEEKFSEHLKFGFYSTNRVAKERQTLLATSLGVSFPDYSLLKTISDKKYPDDTIEIASKLIVEEYRVQYKDRKDGHLNLLKKWSNDDWKNFLNRIDFNFKQSRIEKLNNELLDDVRRCHLFSSSQHRDKEGLILGALMDKIEELQHKDNFSSRFVKHADVEVLFLKAKNSQLERIDPAADVWNEIDTEDGRTIDDKITQVSSENAHLIIKKLKRKAAVGSSLVSKSAMDKSLKATLFRIYDHVEDELDQKRDSLLQMTCSEISNIIEELTDSSFKIIESVNKDFYYTVKSRESIRDLILHLFDSCYLAFDKVSDE